MMGTHELSDLRAKVRTREQINAASQFASALHQMLVEERALRGLDIGSGRSADAGDRAIDILYKRLGAELGLADVFGEPAEKADGVTVYDQYLRTLDTKAGAP